MKRKKEIIPKSREMINEAADIVINTDNDADAVTYLRETLDDNFPDLELGTMDLHKAIRVLDGEFDERKKASKMENLSNAFDSFMSKTTSNRKPKKKKSTKRKPRR